MCQPNVSMILLLSTQPPSDPPHVPHTAHVHTGDALIVAQWPSRGLPVDQGAVDAFKSLQVHTNHVLLLLVIAPTCYCSCIVIALAQYMSLLLPFSVIIALQKLPLLTQNKLLSKNCQF